MLLLQNHSAGAGSGDDERDHTGSVRGLRGGGRGGRRSLGHRRGGSRSLGRGSLSGRGLGRRRLGRRRRSAGLLASRILGLLRVVELDGLEELIQRGQSCLNQAETKTLDHSSDKWVKYYLTNEELQVLRRQNSDSRISNATDLYEINVGLVSGENDFFLSDWENVVARDLQADMKPIISRAEQVKGINLSEEEYQLLREAGKKVSIFMPDNLPVDQLSASAQSYISWGENQGFNKNYKCLHKI